MLPETKNMQLATFGGVRHAGKHESAVLAITVHAGYSVMQRAPDGAKPTPNRPQDRDNDSRPRGDEQTTPEETC